MAPTNPPPGTNLPPDSMFTPRNPALKLSQCGFEAPDEDEEPDEFGETGDGVWRSYADLMKWVEESGGVVTDYQQYLLHDAGFREVGRLGDTQREVFAIRATTYNQYANEWEEEKRDKEMVDLQGRSYTNILLFVSPFHLRDDGVWEVVEKLQIDHSAGLTASRTQFVAWGELQDWSRLAPKVQYQARQGVLRKYGEMWFKIKQDLR